MADDSTLHCSFCGKSQHEVNQIIAGPSVFICDECIDLCIDIVHEDPIVVPLQTGTAPTQVEIRKALDRAIDGQDPVERVLAEMVHRHFWRLVHPTEEANTESPPANILLCGPSLGRGEILRGLTRCLPIPVATVDAARLMEIRSAEQVTRSIVHSLFDSAGASREEAQRAILYVDDFDCLTKPAAKPSGASKDLGTDVQRSLVSLMQGTVVEIPTGFRAPLPRKPARSRVTEDERQDELKEPFQLSDAQVKALVEFGLLPDLVDYLSGLAAMQSPRCSHE